ncbi:membrane protein involved in colicin uptake [Sphingomonas zeicaulis]|uniref:hypothetical protein n=1 Tax=Sphingomonas zeicaulis TaxID=1632740 RepID=UPI003D1F4C72
MDRDVYRSPATQTGYRGDLDAEAAEPAGKAARRDGLSAEENRGKRAPRSGSGAVIGSGAGAGGGGGAEDHDSDAVGGGGAVHHDHDRPVGKGADGAKGGSR